VWRLDWHPTCRTRLLAAAMHGGLCVADVRDASAPRKVAANYCEHGSIQHPQLVYGAGWYAGCTRGHDLEGDIGASVSFYDRSLHLWRLSRTLGAADGANSDGCRCAIVLLSLRIGAIPISSGTRIGTRGTENSDLAGIGIVSRWLTEWQPALPGWGGSGPRRRARRVPASAPGPAAPYGLGRQQQPEQLASESPIPDHDWPEGHWQPHRFDAYPVSGSPHDPASDSEAAAKHSGVLTILG
jgi:hypothetical protein